MNKNTSIKSAGMVAIAALMFAGSAQAAMGGCMFSAPLQGNASGCATEAGNGQACPVQGGNAKAACPSNNKALGDMVGNMAAGGVQVAASVIRALASEASRQLASEPGM
jgi:hypothetical protein